MSDQKKLSKLRSLYWKMQFFHPIAMSKAKNILSQYPELEAAIHGILENKLPDPTTLDYTEYTEKVLTLCPELKHSLTIFLSILSNNPQIKNE